LRRALAQVEAYFHGTSSGTDPLVCYLQRPILLNKTEVFEITNHQPPITNHQIFLLDTGKPREATEFIHYFLKKMESRAIGLRVQKQLLPMVEATIQHFTEGNGDAVFDGFHDIGQFQYKYLRGLIPPMYRKLWAGALDGDLFKLKVCGAGGGGFILGMTQDMAALRAALPKERILPVVV
jgi:mevalonate kinase